MTDVDLIYAALLRAERKMEEWPARDPTMRVLHARLGFLIIQTIRQEIGNALAKSEGQ
jgi:hypothetical protein